jgi:transaldolase
MIKIPGTSKGLPAVEQVISEGINVNVTLLFSVNSYVETAWAYIRGLEKRAEQGEDISKIASVASFFLSRIDSNIDDRLDEKLKEGVDDLEYEGNGWKAIKGKSRDRQCQNCLPEVQRDYRKRSLESISSKRSKSPAALVGKYRHKKP